MESHLLVLPTWPDTRVHTWPKMNHLHHYTSHLQQGNGPKAAHLWVWIAKKEMHGDPLHPTRQRHGPVWLGCFGGHFLQAETSWCAQVQEGHQIPSAAPGSAPAPAWSSHIQWDVGNQRVKSFEMQLQWATCIPEMPEKLEKAAGTPPCSPGQAAWP